MDDIPNSDATLGLFLLTSFPTALLVSLLLFAPAPAQDPPPSRFDRALRAAGFEQNSRMLKFLVLLLVVVILPMFAVIGFGPLHGKQHPFFSYYGYLLGGNFRHIVEGVLFGLIVPFWIARVYRTDPAAKWPLSLYLETAFVLLVFVLGAGDALAPYTRTVTSIPTPWGAVALAPSPTGEAGAVGPKPDRSLYGSHGGGTGGASLAPNIYGLETLVVLKDYIRRDRDYIKLQPSAAVLTGADFGAAASERLGDILYRTFGTLAACHARLNAVTGEIDFTRRNLAPLIPRFPRFISNPDADAALKLAKAFLASTSATLTAVYADFGPAAYDEARETACGPLLTLPCGEWGAKADLPDHKAYCEKVCTDDVCSGLKPKLENVASFGFPDMFDDPALAKALGADLLKADCGPDKECPYTVLLFAALTSATGEPWVGEKKLVEWLNANSAKEPKTLNHRNWSRIRLLLFGATLLDQWGDRDARTQDLRLALSQALIDELYGFSVTHAGLELLRSTTAQNNAAQEAEFEEPALLERLCDLNNGGDKKITLAAAYVSNAINYVDLLEQQPDSWDEYSAKAAAIMHDMHLDLSCMKAALEQAAEPATQGYPDSAARLAAAKTAIDNSLNLYQANIRRLEAQRILLDVAANATLLSASERQQKVSSALRMVAAARRMLSQAYKNADRKLTRLTNFSEPDQTLTDVETNIMTSYRQLADVKTRAVALLAKPN